MAGENAGFLHAAQTQCRVTVKRYTTPSHDAAAWSVCDPSQAEIDTPSEAALGLLSKEKRGTYGALELHEILHLLLTMCPNVRDHMEQQAYMRDWAKRLGMGDVEFHRFFNVVEDPRIERAGVNERPGRERGFHDLVLAMWLSGDMNYSPEPAKSGDVKNVLQQYLLLHARCVYHKVTEMDADDLAARQDLEDMIGADKVKEINRLLHDIIMTGHIGDGKVLENTKHVMDQLAKILQLAGVGKNSQQDQSGQGQGQGQDSQQSDQSQNQQGQGQSDSSNSQQSQAGDQQSQAGDQQSQGQGQGEPDDSQPDEQTQADADSLRMGNGNGQSVVKWDPDASMSEGTQLAKDLQKDLTDAVAKAEQQANSEGTMSEVSAESVNGRTETGDAKADDGNLPGGKALPDPVFEGGQLFKSRLTQQTLARRSFETGGIKKWAKAYRQSLTGIKPTADTRRTMTLSKDRGHDVDILLDASGSMGRNGKRDAAITAAWGIHHALLGVPNVTARVLSFSGVITDEVKTIIPVRGRASFTEAVKKYTVRGGTPTAEAVVESTKGLLSRPGKAKLMVIVTDGAADNPDSCRKAIVRAKRMGIRVVMIGIDGVASTYKDICPVVDVEPDQLRAELFRQLAKNI